MSYMVKKFNPNRSTIPALDRNPRNHQECSAELFYRNHNLPVSISKVPNTKSPCFCIWKFRISIPINWFRLSGIDCLPKVKLHRNTGFPAIYLLLHGLFFTLRLSGGGGSFPRPLKAEEEREYLRRWAQGDLEARNKLVEHNLRLVAHIVKKYYSQSGDQEDLISIGTIGLIKGISTFKSDKNVRLATYASRCIENAILS